MANKASDRYEVAQPPERKRASDWDEVFHELQHDLPGTTVRLKTEDITAPSNLANRLKNRYAGFDVFTVAKQVYAVFDGLDPEERKDMTSDALEQHREELREGAK